MNMEVNSLLIDPSTFDLNALENVQSQLKEQKKTAKNLVDEFTKNTIQSTNGFFDKKVGISAQALLELNLSKLSPEAQEAYKIIEKFLVGDQMKNLKKAAAECLAKPTDQALQQVYQKTLKTLQDELGDGFIKESLSGSKSPAAALDLMEEIVRNPHNLIAKEIEWKFTGVLKTQEAKLVFQNAALEGQVFKSPAHTWPLFLRKLPLIGSWFETKPPDLNNSKAILNARYSNHVLNAGQDLYNNGFKLNTLKTNLKASTPLLKEMAESGVKGFFKGGLKGITKKAIIPVAGLIAATGLVKMNGPIGNLAKTIIDFSFVDGTSDALARGDMGNLSGKIVEHLGLTAATMAVATTGITGAMALGLGSVCPPIIAGVAASAAVYAGLNWAWSSFKGIFNNYEQQEKRVANQEAFQPEDIQALPASLQDNARDLLKQNPNFSI